MTQEPKVRYSDADLVEFKALIDTKIAKAEAELAFTHKQISELKNTGFNQQGGDWYDDTTSHSDLEMLQRMAARQDQFLQNLRNALFRIQQKTYGICTVTGELIDKNRLKFVPHATKSIAGKTKANGRIPVKGPDTMARIKAQDKDNAKKKNISVEGKVRMNGGKRRLGSSDEWEGFDA